MNLKTEPDFRNLFTPLTEDEFAQLKENLKLNPDGFPKIIVWGNYKDGNVIIDGHNQYKARTALAMPVTSKHVKKMKFETRQEAMNFAIKCQVGRRNLPVNAIARLAHKLRINAQLSVSEAAEIAGISPRTVNQYETVQRNGSEALKHAVDEDEVSVSDAAKATELPKSEQTKRVRQKKKGQRRTVSEPESTDFEPAELDRQPSKRVDAKKNGKPTITRKDRTKIHKAYGDLVRLMKEPFDIYDQFEACLDQIAKRLEEI